MLCTWQATNYSNSTGAPQCIDHVIWVRRRRDAAAAGGSEELQTVAAEVVDDMPRHVADHNLMYVTLERVAPKAS